MNYFEEYAVEHMIRNPKCDLGNWWQGTAKLSGPPQQPKFHESFKMEKKSNGFMLLLDMRIERTYRGLETSL